MKFTGTMKGFKVFMEMVNSLFKPSDKISKINSELKPVKDKFKSKKLH